MASLECKVVGITWLPNGSARLALDDHAHQELNTWKPDSLLVKFPPKNVAVLLNRRVWGFRDGYLYCGTVLVGEACSVKHIVLYARGLRDAKRYGAGKG